MFLRHVPWVSRETDLYIFSVAVYFSPAPYAKREIFHFTLIHNENTMASYYLCMKQKYLQVKTTRFVVAVHFFA